MHIHLPRNDWLQQIQWVKDKLDILAWNAVSLPCTQSSSKADTLVCWGSGCLSACLLCRLASRLQASLVCLASACSAALCSRLRSRSFSSLDCLASGCSAVLHSWSHSPCLSAFSSLVPLLCICDHAHTVYLAWPACCSALIHRRWVTWVMYVTDFHSAVLLVWGLLRLAPIS